ncbi:Zinc/iron permease [Cladochytrium replicatum]|nr:Zinc/iron permease [Cladochytrium replicatum]
MSIDGQKRFVSSQAFHILKPLNARAMIQSERTTSCTPAVNREFPLSLHIVSIFVLIATSFVGALLPLVFTSHISKFGIGQKLAQMFSAGVVICTAFVHMLGPACALLASSCLPEIVSHNYKAWAGVVVIFGLLLNHFIQVLIRQAKIVYARAHRVPSCYFVMLDENGRPTMASTDSTISAENAVCIVHDTCGNEEATYDSSTKERQTAVSILAFAIVLHSIIAGIVMGFSDKSHFITHLIALSFSQIFQGIALLTFICDARFASPWPVAFMVFAFTCSTALGIAISIGVNKSSAVDLSAGNLAAGVLEAFSAGILLYDALVIVLAKDFTPRGSSFTTRSILGKLRSKREVFRSGKGNSAMVQAMQILALWFGGFVMAIVKIWFRMFS